MEEHVQEALEIVKAQAQVRSMTIEEINSMVQSLSRQFKGIVEGQKEQEIKGNKTKKSSNLDPKKAIKEKSIICLECENKFKILTKKHLSGHGLTPDEYREKWGYKKKQPLVCKSLARQRRNKMNDMELWQKRKNVNIDKLTNAIVQDFKNKQHQIEGENKLNEVTEKKAKTQLRIEKIQEIKQKKPNISTKDLNQELRSLDLSYKNDRDLSTFLKKNTL